MRSGLLVLLIFTCLENVAFSQKASAKSQFGDSSLENAKVESYKSIGDIELKMFIFNPKDHKESDQRPAIVFFFGGGWKSGSPKQFSKHCEYLAERGMIAMTAEYRVASVHYTKVVDCVADAKSAIRWARSNASRLGIDPNRIAAGGGSAGGHLAACTGVVPGFENSSEASGVSSISNALLLFNPALVLANIEGEQLIPQEKLDELLERIGEDPKNISPAHHVKTGAPPTIIFHGRADTTVPYRTAEIFTEAMQKAGNRCELVGFADKTHGFFNFGRDDNTSYVETMAAADRFLVSLGYLAPVAVSK